MSAARLALIAAVCAVVAWTAKAIAIGVAGGLDRSPAEGPLFLLGLVAAVVAAAALGAALVAGRPRALRVVAAVVAVVALVAVVVAVGGLVSLLEPADPSWVWAEVNLWVAALLLLAGAAVVWRVRPGTAGRHRLLAEAGR